MTSAAPQRPISARSMWLLTALVAAGAIVLLLLVAEGAVRARQMVKYGSAATVEDIFVTDPASGLRVPAVGSHLGGRITVNSLGFRGPEIPAAKPAGTVRIAFLGASTTWCAEVSSDAKAWPHLVAAGLRSSFPGKPVDYVNGGVSGYTLASSLRNLETRVAPLAPDIIVLYEAANDLSGELRSLAADKELIAEVKLAERSWLARNSLLWDLADKNLRVLFAQQAAERKQGRLSFDEATLGKTFRERLTRLTEESKRRAKLVALTTFAIQLRPGQSEEEQIRASASALYYMPFMTPDGIMRAYARYNDIIREVARESGVILVEAADAVPADAAHFTDTVHFTDAGSARLAARVVETLSRDDRVKALFEGR